MKLSGEAKTLIGIGLATLIILIGGVLLASSSNSSQTPNETSTQKISPEQLIKEDSQKISYPSAKVTIVEFLDYECEACGAAHPFVKQILNEYKGKVNFVVRNFPNHYNSVLAANVAEAAGEQGKYWEMHSKLFENQPEWGEKQAPQTELFLSYAEELELDIDKVKEVIESNKYTDKIGRDKQEGIDIGVNATPTFFINGEKEVGVLSYDQWKQKIEAAMQ